MIASSEPGVECGANGAFASSRSENGLNVVGDVPQAWVYRTLYLHHPRHWYRYHSPLTPPHKGHCAEALRYREVNRKRTDLVEERSSIAVSVNGSLVGRV